MSRSHLICVRKPLVSPVAIGCICAATAYTIWGFSYLFTKTALKTATPAVALAGRFLIAFALIHAIRFLGKIPVRLHWRDVKKLLVLGICNPVLYFYLESYGLLYTTTTFSGVMCAMSPLLSMFLAIFFLRELPTKKQGFFSLIPIAGVVLITLSEKSEGLLSGLGILCLFLSCLMGSGAGIVSRKLAPAYSTFERTYFMMLTGCVAFTTVAILQNLRSPHLLIQPFSSPSFLISIFCLGAFCSVGAFFCFNFSTRCLPAATTAIFSNLTTLVSIFAGVVFLSEPISISYIVGSVMIIGGIWLVTQQGNRKAGS